MPLLPTTPFVLLAAFCFSRGSERCERWLLEHPRFGPMVRDWRERRAVPLRAKQLATVMMALGSVWAAFTLPARVAWLPAVVCTAVACGLWRLPTRTVRPPAESPRRTTRAPAARRRGQARPAASRCAHQRAGAHAEQADAARQVDALQAQAGGAADRGASSAGCGSVRSRVTVLKSSKRSLMPMVRPA